MSHTHASDYQRLRNYGYLKFNMICTLRTPSETLMRLSASDIHWSSSLVSLFCVHTPCFHVAPYIDTEVKSGDRGGQLRTTTTTTTTTANPPARELSHMSTDAAPLCGKNICNLGSSVKIILDFYSQFNRVENSTNVNLLINKSECVCVCLYVCMFKINSLTP
jgi:hypothetical protein